MTDIGNNHYFEEFSDKLDQEILPPNSSKKIFDRRKSKLKTYTELIIGYHPLTYRWKNKQIIRSKSM